MSSTDALFAGFGGHGMLLAGKLLALAGMSHGHQVSWVPAYGAEMRGGTANVTVCLGDEKIGSPYIERPTSLVVMNTPSLIRFGQKVRPGGLIIMNTTLVKEPFSRDDCTVFGLPASDIAASAGSMKATNLVLLGAYGALSQVVPLEVFLTVIENQFALKPAFQKLNMAAFSAGVAAVTESGDNWPGATQQRSAPKTAAQQPYAQSHNQTTH